MLKLIYTTLVGMWLGVSCLLLPYTAAAQIDTVDFKNYKLNTAYLKPGLRQYLVTLQSPVKNKALNLSYWVRDIKIDTRNGEKVFTTLQHWYSNDTLAHRTYYSVNRMADFAPLYHTETMRNHTKAYNWTAQKITSVDTVAVNDIKSFSLDFNAPNYNWNLDIETFEMLPLAAGKTFAINFYDAGYDKPDYVLYKVTGSEILLLLDNTKVDCWKLLTEGKAPNGAPYTQTFWISKKSHELLKEEDKFNGAFRIKIKLPGTMPDVVTRFKS